jgi:Subtilase family
MATHEHLRLTRPQRPPAARKKPPRGFRPQKAHPDYDTHASDLDGEAISSVEDYERRIEEVDGFDPKLILRFSLNRPVVEDEWHRSGLTVLDSCDSEAVVVFANEDNLDRFRERLAAYAEGPGEPQPREDGKGETEPSPSYSAFFDAIDGLRFMEPADRITQRLAEALDVDPDASRPFDVELWYTGDEEVRESWMGEAADRAEEHEGEVLDRYVNASAGIALARVRGNRATVNGLAELDQIASIDLVPKPRLERSELADLQDADQIGDPDPPPGDAPVVGMIDSGVLEGHPLLEPAIVEATALHSVFDGQGEDSNGHGTMVAGLTLYGDVLAAARADDFEPEFWLASVRVLGDDGRVPEEVNWERAIADAVEHLVDSWQVRVINISIANPDRPFAGGKSSTLAAMLDTMSRVHRVLFVICAGNLEEAAIDHEGWPDYLYEDEASLLDPGQASAALTVGAISLADGLNERSIGTTLDAAAIAEPEGPAPFTRRGPGVRGAIKPELVADGGNCRYEHAMAAIQPDVALEVLSTSGRHPNRIFEASRGTSFAAPTVANIAGRLVAEYPSYTPNAIRALILQGASYPAGAADAIEQRYDDHEKRLQQLCGYGAVVWERCALSEDNRVVMIAEDVLSPDDFHVYRIPMTEEFTDVKGFHQVTASLAFTPPVRHRRLDYMAFQMEFQLVRAISIDDVYELASAESELDEEEEVEDADEARDSDAEPQEENKKGLSAYELPMRPPITHRSKGANQMARYQSERRPGEKFHGDWFLVVRSLDKWMPPDSEPQPYALAICLEVEGATQLFLQLEAEIEAQAALEAVLEPAI